MKLRELLVLRIFEEQKTHNIAQKKVIVMPSHIYYTRDTGKSPMGK